MAGTWEVMPPLAEAVANLRRLNQGTFYPSEAKLEEAEEEAFKKLQEREREEEERRCPSLRSIPRFFERKATPLDEPNSLRSRVLREARQRLLQRKSHDLLDEADLHLILQKLKEHSRSSSVAGIMVVESIDYVSFTRVRDELAERENGGRFLPFFAAKTFLKFPRDAYGCIAILPFFTFVFRKVNIQQTRMSLSPYDGLGCGYLREKDLENFVFDMIPTLPQLNAMQEIFYPFYVFTAVRKFFFFLDPKRTGRIHIREMLLSSILTELYELRQEQPLEEPERNWFSMDSATRVYGAYLELDTDQNGMLSKTELKNYGSAMLTDVFIDRVFEEYQTYRDAETGKREMDYKTFLDFVLAMENKNEPQALQYFWKLIDIDHSGSFGAFGINYFFGEIQRTLAKKKVECASVDDIQDEIFDMVRAKERGVIYLQDLIDCKQGGTVLSMLTDAAAFWRYDNREKLMLDSDDDEEFTGM